MFEFHFLMIVLGIIQAAGSLLDLTSIFEKQPSKPILVDAGSPQVLRGPLTGGGGQCCMSISRNGNVPCQYLCNSMSILE